MNSNNVIDYLAKGLTGVSQQDWKQALQSLINNPDFQNKIKGEIKEHLINEGQVVNVEILQDERGFYTKARALGNEGEFFVYARIQSGKTQEIINQALNASKDGFTVLVIVDDNQSLLSQTITRSKQQLEKYGMLNNLKTEADILKRGNIVITMGNSSRLKKINLKNDKHDLYILLDEADVAHKKETTKYQQEIERIKSEANTFITVNVSATQYVLAKDKNLNDPKIGYGYIEVSETYKGYEDLQIVVKEDMTTENIPHLLNEMIQEQKDLSKKAILIKTEHKQSQQKIIYDTITTEPSANCKRWVFIVNSKFKKGKCSFSDEEMTFADTDSVKKKIDEECRICQNLEIVIIGDRCIDRGNSIRNIQYDEDLWSITGQIYKSSPNARQDSVAQGLRIVGNFDDDIQRVVYTDTKTKQLLDDYYNNEKQYIPQIPQYNEESQSFVQQPSTIPETCPYYHKLGNLYTANYYQKQSKNMGLNYKGLTDGAVSIKNPKCAKNIVFTQGDIERYVRRWYLENDSAISKIFKYVYNRVYVSEERLIRFITSLDSENPLAYKNHLTNKNKPHYHIFKIRKDGKIGIKRNIREYVEEIIKESD